MMLKFTRHFYRQENDVNFNDDWELIEVLDQEFAGEIGGERMFDPVDTELSPSPFTSHKIKYRILTKADIRQLLEEKILRVSTVLSLSRSDAVVLLNHFNWRVSRVCEEWLTDEEKVRKDVGLYKIVCAWEFVETSDTKDITCSFCYESRVADDMVAVSCGHQMCRLCWTDYITEAISDGHDCLALQCPEGVCDAAVGIDMIKLFFNKDNEKTIDNYLLNSYINGRIKVKWCPASGCEYAVAASYGLHSNSDVTCKCLHSFCWNCSKEAHTPIHCSTVNDWQSEKFVQSNNWLLAQARPCPSCGKLIEKISCQRYSRCTLCDYQFLDDAVSDDAPMNEGAVLSDDQVELMKACARSFLERFQQHYEGWSRSEACRVNALTDLKVLNDLQLDYLCSKLGLHEFELHFLDEAYKQVVHCWRLVKWSYAYGYYIPQDEILKKNMLDFWLEQAVKLVKMIENHVKYFIQGVLDSKISATDYHISRDKIIRLTRVTGMYFERLVEALNDNLSEVVTISQSSPRRETDLASCSNPDPIKVEAGLAIKPNND